VRSTLTTELKLQYNPIAILFSDNKPDGARQLREKSWGCVMALYSLTIKKGMTVAFDRTTYGCIGGGVGLCLGDTYKPNREFMENLLSEEEGYFKTRLLVREFMDDFPYVDIPHRYVVFKPLEKIDEKVENPALVSIPANADQISALAALINFRRHGNNHIHAPFCAGCQSVCVIPYNESDRENPRAVIGNLDLASRKVLPPDILTFTVPFKTFCEMEEDAPISLIRKKTWTRIASRIDTPEK
jgi:uncharacterized protein (DUF169 family)